MTTPQKAMNACLYMLGEGLAGGAVAVALEKAGVVLEDVVVKTDLSTTVTGQQYSSIVFVCSSDVSVDAKGLTAACKPLVPGGKVLLVQPSAQVRGDTSSQFIQRLASPNGSTWLITCRHPASGLSSCVG